MSQTFAEYSEILTGAYEFNPKKSEVIERKKEIVDSIIRHYGPTPTSVLFCGFSPLILSGGLGQMSVTGITAKTKNFLDKLGIKYTYVKNEDLLRLAKKFNWVVATDEYFTFAQSEQDQLDKIKEACSLAKDLVITTLKDYKNQDYREREFSQPLALHNANQTKIFLEHHNHSLTDRNSWSTRVWDLGGSSSEEFGPFARRAMYFKQLAKFSIDAGAKSFYVHKNLMYKGLTKKNYEHVISINFN